MPGSHGSLTKAGKVRHQTPKVSRTGVNSVKKFTPRKRFKVLYQKKVVEGKYGGQPQSLGAKRATFTR